MEVIVGVAATVRDGLVSWAWAAEDGVSARGVFRVDVGGDPTRLGMLVAVDHLLERHEVADFLDVRTPDRELSESLERFARSRELGNFAKELGLASGSVPLLRSLSHAFGWIAVVAPWDEITPSGQLVRRAQTLSKALLPMIVEDAPRLHPGVLVGATDGSRGRRPDGGWAWVTADGRSGHGVKAGDIVAVELEAVAQLLAGIPREQEMEILVDSKDALDLIQRCHLYRQSGWMTGRGPVRYASVLKRIDSLLAGRKVRLCWIPAHRGFELNEAANRLALYARRVHEASGTAVPVPAEIEELTTERIVAEVAA
ncbi:MAG: RNase H family protein [Actinomycetota bacterium]